MITKTLVYLDPGVVRARCAELGISLNELSKRSGINRSHLARMMNAGRQPRAETFDRLASVLECDSNDLVKVDTVELPEQPASSLGAAIRMMAFAHYGSECVCCGETENSMLTLDEVKPGASPGPQDLLFRWLHRHAYPAGYQTLCLNCHSAKLSKGSCPHTGGTPMFASDAARVLWSLKVDAIRAYGGKCVCCNEANPHFLSVGITAAHRTALGVSGRNNVGAAFYRALRRAGYPTVSPFPMRVRCFNCAPALDDGLPCPHQETQA
jgi:transcriptional regulator with XRE-family HTH domain